MSALDDGLKLTPDQAAAQQFLTELRSRISTQPLPYQYVVEESAAEAHPLAGNEWQLTGTDKSAAWDIYEVSSSSSLVTIRLAPFGRPDKHGITGILGDQPKCCCHSDSTRSAP
jgi:hypothetical protein